MPPVLYTDGGSIGNGQVNQRARMAVFDPQRNEIVVDAELGALTNNEAEYRAIEAALEYAATHGLRGVELRSDSQLCVNQIRGTWKVKEARLKVMADRARARLAEVGGTITWIPREQNVAGHHLEGGSLGASQPASERRYCLRCGAALVARQADHRGRPTCPRCAWVYFEDPKVAVAAILEMDGGIVLCRRAIEPGLGKWSFPAGFVDRGERVEGALIREIAEETGLTARLRGLVGVYSETENPVVLIVYSAEARGKPRPSQEASAVEVFPVDRLPELAFAHDARIVEDWRHQASPSAVTAA